MSSVRNTYISSISGFLIKGLSALYINYAIAKSASLEQYSFLAIIMSIGMLLSIADFGIGQYIVTVFSDTRVSVKKKHLYLLIHN